MRKKLVISLAVISLITVTTVGVIWFINRAAIASARHSLNYPEWDKDKLAHATREKCKELNSMNIWIPKNDIRYSYDRLATSSYIYRHVALDSNVMQNDDCFKSFISTAVILPYSISISFISTTGAEIANFTSIKN